MNPFLLVAALLLAPLADTDESTEAAGLPHISTRAESTRAELKVYIDPQTGEVTSQPTARQQQELEELIRLDARRLYSPPLPTFELTGGGIGVRLDQRFFSALTITPSDDGWHYECEQDHPDHTPHIGGPSSDNSLKDEPPRDSAGRAVQ